MSAVVLFALASTAHAGFQVTVTTLVYPALAATVPNEWPAAHQRHSRSITPLVVGLYGALVVSGVAFVVVGPGPAPARWVAISGAAASMLLTATLAGPIHGRLGGPDQGPGGALMSRLLLVDRWRCAAALVGAVAAGVTLLP